MSCGYQGYHFGAHYEDGACIKGFLWDLDSCEEPGGALYSGGDQPCPECNAKAYAEDAKEELNEDGYFSCEHPVEPKDFPKFQRFPHLRRKLKKHWMKGRKEWAKEHRQKGRS